MNRLDLTNVVLKRLHITLLIVAVWAVMLPMGLVAWRYPLGGNGLLSILAGYAFILWYWPAGWLAILPSVLLAVDLTPWTGWLLCDEADMVLAITVAIGYSRLAWTPPIHRLTPVAAPLLLLFSAAFLVSLTRGLWPLPVPDFNALTDYTNSYNGLRIAKGTLWALLLLPLLRRTLAENHAQRYLLSGLLIALIGVSAVVFWERLTFTGLLDFSSDYRATGPFSAMHTGGAALDGSLALLTPFAILWLLQARQLNYAILAVIIVGLSVYAIMAIFSRGLYLGFGLSVAIISVSALPGRRDSRKPLWQSLLLLSLLCLTAGLLFQVFATGGYRTLAAILALLISALFVGSLSRALLPGGSYLAIGFVACLASQWLLWQWLAKGAYWAFGLAAMIWIAGILIFGSKHRPVGVILGMVGFAGMVVGTGLVAWHWGGKPALISTLPAMGLALGLVILNFRLRVWRWERSTVLGAGLAVMILGISIPVTGNYYMEQRFSQAEHDWETRLQHWRAVLFMMNADWATDLWGMGIGKFPATYFWRNPADEFPGNFQYETENNNTFLRISGARYPRGYGEPLRIGQRVAPRLYALYTLSLDARAPEKPAIVNIALCQKWLLYPFGCSGRSLKIENRDWQYFEITLNTLGFAGDVWGSRRTAQLILSNSTGGALLDVDNIQLNDPISGAELLANGNFSHSGDRWFFTSDRHHLPWHAKNLWLNILFDQGWIGVVLFGLLTLLGLARAFLEFEHRDNSLALALFASLSGFLTVGLFDSLLDVPRLTLMYYLLLFTTLLEPFPLVKTGQPVHAHRPTANHHVPSHSRVQVATWSRHS
ncbi:MAG: hypothetical protein KDJ31_05810 [Candidatus Competibacteraceae bacterium]|nr:hypothetical protein [Candidatus Competibacteraceae bacterium]